MATTHQSGNVRAGHQHLADWNEDTHVGVNKWQAPNVLSRRQRHTPVLAIMLKSGDIVVANHRMRSWVSDTERGRDGFWIEEGVVATVVETWEVGGHTRIRVLLSDRVVVVSHETLKVTMNWNVVGNHGHGFQTLSGAAEASRAVDPRQR